MGFWNFAAQASGLVGNSPASQRFFDAISKDMQSGGDAAYDREYWRYRMRLTNAERIVENNIPVLLWSGWGDIVETGAVRVYTALQNAHNKRGVYLPMDRNLATSPRYQIIMGGWGHADGLDAGIYLQWMDTWLKGIATHLSTARGVTSG